MRHRAGDGEFSTSIYLFSCIIFGLLRFLSRLEGKPLFVPNWDPPDWVKKSKSEREKGI